MTKDYVVGVDIGGQSSKIGLVDRMGNIVAQEVMRYGADSPRQYKENDAELFIEDLCKYIGRVVGSVGIDSVQGIGIGAPNANYYTGTIEDAANLLWAKGRVVYLSQGVSKHFNNIKVTITNDANAAAVGEMTYGAAKGMKNFIEITLGTGVGSGIVINGEVVYGADGLAGELGHTVAIRNNGRQCNCGKRGCLEAYASAIGVARTAREWLEADLDKKMGNGRESSLRHLVDITSKDIYDAAKEGDPMAIEVFDYTAKLLGYMFADFIAFSAPEAIILFGGLAKAKEFLLDKIQKYMDDEVVSFWRGKVKVLPSSLKESDAAILGAASLAW